MKHTKNTVHFSIHFGTNKLLIPDGSTDGNTAQPSAHLDCYKYSSKQFHCDMFILHAQNL